MILELFQGTRIHSLSDKRYGEKWSSLITDDGYLGIYTNVLFYLSVVSLGVWHWALNHRRNGPVGRSVGDGGQQLRVGLRGIDQSGGAGPGDCDIRKQHGKPTDQLRVGRDRGSQWTGQRRTLLLLHQGPQVNYVLSHRKMEKISTPWD